MAKGLGWLEAICSGFLDLLFPPRCQCCREFSEALLCPQCLQGFAFIEAPFCEMCGAPFDPLSVAGRLCGECYAGRCLLDRIRSLLHYRDTVRTAIHEFKYRGRQRLYRPLGEMMAQRFAEWFGDLQVQVVTPVPLHRRRERDRGFNQAELLAAVICERHSLPLGHDLLIRSKFTKPQIELTRAQRAVNVRGAFTVARPEEVRGRRLLLVDDVFTTGATLSACARALKRAGAAAVYGYTLARGD